MYVNTVIDDHCQKICAKVKIVIIFLACVLLEQRRYFNFVSFYSFILSVEYEHYFDVRYVYYAGFTTDHISGSIVSSTLLSITLSNVSDDNIYIYLVRGVSIKSS